MSTFFTETRQIMRALAARPAFVIIAALTLALGIGANTAIFSTIDALLLKDLPYHDSDRLVMMWGDGSLRGFPERDVANAGVMHEWQRSLNTVESIAGIDFWNTTYTSGQGGDHSAALVQGARVSAGFFDTLGVQPAMGRGFTAEEDVENGARVVVVSHDFWQRELSGNPDVLGTAVQLDREPWTVVGVLPPGFIAPTLPEARLLKPLQAPDDPNDGFWLVVFARIKPDVTIEQLDADLDRVQARLAAEYPDELRDVSGNPQYMQEFLVQGVSLQLMVLMGATLFVMLIACANIANLLLARAIGRTRELALRAAVGATRTHIVRQLLIESTLLSLLGMALGIVIAGFGIHWITTALPAAISTAAAPTIDLRVLGFALAAAVLSGIVSGAIPALLASRRDPGIILRDGERGATSLEGARARALLVTGTFALALALTVSAGLFLKSLMRILDVDPGFRAEGLFTFTLSLPENEYPDGDALRMAQDTLQESLAAVPGVTAVGFTSTLPMGGLITDTGTLIEGVPHEGEPFRTWYSRVSPGYLPTLGTPLMRGRDFTINDRAGAPCVVIANETYVTRYLGGEDPIGRRALFRPRSDEPIPCEIVGLVRDLRFNALDQPPDPTLYMPNGTFPNRRFFVVMRTEGEPAALLPAVQQAVSSFDPGMAVWAPAPMATLVEDSMRTPRLVTLLVGAFAVLALTLAATGVYGVSMYNVTARMREFGVRTALGAKQGDLLRQVLKGGLRLVLAGMVVGVLLTVAFGRVLDSILYEVEPFDLQVFVSVSVLLVLAAFLAMLMPARKAAQVQPMEALRYE